MDRAQDSHRDGRTDGPTVSPRRQPVTTTGGPSIQSDSVLLRCGDCNMIFGDTTLLQKHKARFCVGSHLGDPEVLMLRRRMRDQDRPPDLNLPEDEEETPRYDASKDARVQQLAELHGKQMEYLKNQNRELEQQREDIRRQLEELGRRQPPAAKDNTTEQLLRELKEEEARSQKILEDLRRQLADASNRPVNIISTQPERPPVAETKTYAYPLMFGGSLIEEIRSVRQAYIKNGGTDQEILAQLDQLLSEAASLEDSLKNVPPKQPKEKEEPSQLIMVELENKRLLEQLIQLQEQKIMNKRPKDSREGDLERELRHMRHDHLRKMHELQLQIERMRQDSLMDRLLLEVQMRGNQPRTAQPTKLILKQRPPPPPPAPQLPQVTEPPEEPGYEEDSSPGRYHMYGHTWVHTQHRQDVEEDPDFDLGL